MREPVIEIIGAASDRNLIAGWQPALVSVTLTDHDGGEADELSIVFSVLAPFMPGPAEGTAYFPRYGWRENGAANLRPAGRFEVQNTSYEGDAESGYTMTVTARSADFVDKMKQMGSEHFEDTTAGEIFKKVAGKTGISAEIDPEIAKTKIPYRLRWSQSPAGFATDLANDLGGTVKLSNGKLLVAKRNSGKTATGTEMPVIAIAFSQTKDVSISVEGRPEYAKTGASWFDPEEGIAKEIEGQSVGQGGKLVTLHPFASEDEARLGGEAQGREQARSSISGSITTIGMIDAMAGAPVKLSGFGEALDGLDIVAPTITHEFSFDDSGGWLTTVDLESRKSK